MPNDGRNISWNEAYWNILVHDVINLLYYNNQISSIICGHLYGDMFLSVGIGTGCIDVSSVPKDIINFLAASEVLFEAAFVTLSTILFPTKSPVNFAGFFLFPFLGQFWGHMLLLFSVFSKSFYPNLLLKLLPVFFAKDKNP